MEDERFDHPAMDELNAALANYDAAEKLLQEAVICLPLKIGRNEELREAIIHHIYWEEPFIRQTWLAKAFGMTVMKIKDIAAKKIIIPCKACGDPQEVPYKKRPGGTDNSLWNKDICPSCQQIEKEQRAEASQRFMAQREARKRLLHTMPYGEYLQTPEWQETRKAHLKRSRYRCQVCNAYGVQLDVHHRTYERRGYEYAQDLLALCRNCHDIFHANGKLARD